MWFNVDWHVQTAAGWSAAVIRNLLQTLFFFTEIFWIIFIPKKCFYSFTITASLLTSFVIFLWNQTILTNAAQFFFFLSFWLQNCWKTSILILKTALYYKNEAKLSFLNFKYKFIYQTDCLQVT